MIPNPTPCRVVLYHFTILGDDHKHVTLSRPAMVTSIGPSDDVINLFVFFEPRDLEAGAAGKEGLNQSFVCPYNPANRTGRGWSWPPRS